MYVRVCKRPIFGRHTLADFSGCTQLSNIPVCAYICTCKYAEYSRKKKNVFICDAFKHLRFSHLQVA